MEEKEKEELVQAKQWGLIWCLGILGPQADIWQLGSPDRPLF